MHEEKRQQAKLNKALQTKASYPGPIKNVLKIQK